MAKRVPALRQRKRDRTAAELLREALDSDSGSRWTDCPECHCADCRRDHPHDCEIIRAISTGPRRRRTGGQHG